MKRFLINVLLVLYLGITTLIIFAMGLGLLIMGIIGDRNPEVVRPDLGYVVTSPRSCYVDLSMSPNGQAEYQRPTSWDRNAETCPSFAAGDSVYFDVTSDNLPVGTAPSTPTINTFARVTMIAMGPVLIYAAVWVPIVQVKKIRKNRLRTARRRAQAKYRAFPSARHGG
ncbi:hypothetical protein [Glutamicibacter sp.]|uniref:hypothetical protein n=1 Tax=Glutamicibacter sp. TaxID=1931995 RepID=UPI0028BDDE30|nr:hypothetical protein [Glutamicibacter sp.]